MTSSLSALDTPVALIEEVRLMANIRRMQERMNALGVRFRPHVKTAKCLPVADLQRACGAQGVTVSTLKEAQAFFDAGEKDILYAVGIAPGKLPQVLDLRRRGCRLQILLDNVDTAAAVSAFGRAHGEAFEVWIEIDSDSHRSGLFPDDPALIEVARTVVDGGMRLSGVMTHAGASYALETPQALAAMAEQERERTVRAAARLREAGWPCPGVSVGSTPTALSAAGLAGVTEVRAGVYVFFDLVMHNVGVCRFDEIALSVLATVIGHQRDKGWAIIDAGWMAMSRDRGTQKQKRDYGYGQVASIDGTVLEDYVVSEANQEHGIVSRRGAPEEDVLARFPVGTRLRILPNHACATAAQFPGYRVLREDGRIETWPRFYGW